MLQFTTSNNSGLQIQPDSKAVIAERVKGEFREMPGLTLTLAQAQRLWSLDSLTCTEVLSQLVDTGFLCRKSDGAYGRVSDLTARSSRMAKAGIQFVNADQPARTSSTR